jgi:site-specific recombinase XerD
MKRPAEPLTAREALALLAAACPNGYPTGKRNRALLALLWRSGLRISEALALRPSDVNRRRGSILVRHGKGDKSRTVGIDPDALALLEPWLAVRPNVRGAPLFCTLKGEALDTSYVRHLLPRLAKRAGIDKRVHAHGLRHTLAVELMCEGADVGLISRQLGHSSIHTTARYLDHVAPQRVIDRLAGRGGWLSGLAHKIR